MSWCYIVSGTKTPLAGNIDDVVGCCLLSNQDTYCFPSLPQLPPTIASAISLHQGAVHQRITQRHHTHQHVRPTSPSTRILRLHHRPAMSRRLHALPLQKPPPPALALPHARHRHLIRVLALRRVPQVPRSPRFCRHGLGAQVHPDGHDAEQALWELGRGQEV